MKIIIIPRSQIYPLGGPAVAIVTIGNALIAIMDDLKYRVKSIKEDAMHIGTNMHSLAEDYILGKEVIAPRIIIADAENPLHFHKIMDL